jgi:hypothetical protein
MLSADSSAEGAKCWNLFRTFSAHLFLDGVIQGVAPGYYISRLWRSAEQTANSKQQSAKQESTGLLTPLRTDAGNF